MGVNIYRARLYRSGGGGGVGDDEMLPEIIGSHNFHRVPLEEFDPLPVINDSPLNSMQI